MIETTALDVFMADIAFPDWVEPAYKALRDDAWERDEAMARVERAMQLIDTLPHKHSCSFYDPDPRTLSDCDCGRNDGLAALAFPDSQVP